MCRSIFTIIDLYACFRLFLLLNMILSCCVVLKVVGIFWNRPIRVFNSMCQHLPIDTLSNML